MKAMRVSSAQHGPVLVEVTLPEPEPEQGQLLIRVRAAGVTPTEVLWYPTTHTKEGAERSGAVPGHEFSGIVPLERASDAYNRTIQARQSHGKVVVAVAA